MAAHRSDRPNGQGEKSHHTSKQRGSREKPVCPRQADGQPAPPATVLEGITDGLIALDRHWRYTYVNEAAAALFKTTPGAMLGKTMWEMFPQLQDSRFYDEFTRAAQEKVFVKVEDYYEPTGHWYECRCYPTEEGVTVFFNDITGNKRIEEAILESRQALEMAITGSDAGIWRVDLDPERPGVIPDYAYLSPQLKALIGFENDEFPNSRSAWRDRILPEDRPCLEEAVEAYAGGRTPIYQVDFRIRHKNGSIRWLSSRGRLYSDEFNRPVRWAGVDTDVTERKYAEEAMRRLKEQAERAAEQATWLARISEENPGPVLRISGEHVMLYGNPAAEKLCVYWSCRIGRKVPPVIQGIVSDALAARVVTSHEILCGDRTFLLTATPCPTGDYVNLFAQDITPRKHAEEALRETNERLQAANERLQTQREELQNQAEELRTQHEELQSQADELRDGKQALRRLNEELEQRVEKRTADLRKANQALRRAGAYNRSLIEASLDPLVAIGRDGRITDVNRATEEITGYSRTELIGADFSDYFTEPEKADAGYRQVFRDGLVQDYPLEVRHKTGRVTPVLYNAAVYRDDAGQVVGVFAAARDVTKLRQAEGIVSVERRRFNDVLETLPAYLILLTPDHHVAFANRFFRERFGDSKSKRCFEFLFHRTEPCPVCETYKVLETRHPLEWEWTGPDGRNYHIHDFPFADADGSPLIMEMGIDITDLKRAEAALKEANETLEGRVQERTAALRKANEQLHAQTEELRAQREELQKQAEELRAQTRELQESEPRLRESEEIARQRLMEIEDLYRNAPVGLCVLDAELRWVRINERMARANGFSVAEHIGKRVRDLIPRLADAVEAPMRQVLETGEPMLDIEVTDDAGGPGMPRIWSASWLPIKNADGAVVGISVVADDITVRKAAEETRRESEERFRTIFDGTTDGLLIADPKSRKFLMGNKTICDMLGYTPTEIAGMQIADIHRKEDMAFVAEHFSRLANGEERTGASIPVRRKDSSVFFADITANPIILSGKTYLVGCFRDITERKRAEEALAASEQRLRLALEGGHMGRWEWDITTDSSLCDERTYELLGLDACHGARIETFLNCIHPQDRGNVKDLIEKSVAERTDFQAEFRVVHRKEEPPDEIVWLASACKVLCDERNQPARLIGVLYDVTQRRQMEEQLRLVNKHLESEVQTQTEELRDTIDRLQDEVVRRVLAEGKLRKSSQMLEGFFQHTITPLAFMDRRFNFVRVNEAYAKAEGKSPEFFKGRNHFTLYPHDENQAIFEQVVRTGRPHRAFAKPFQCPGDPLRVTYRDWQLTPLQNDRGDVQYLVLNLQDVTQQQAALRELEHRACQLQKLTLELSLAEDRERRRMAEVLHDGLQQQLAAAKFHLGLLNSRARSDPGLQEIGAQLDSMLHEAIEQSRSLSHELSPAVLYQSDLGETFEWLARQVKTKYGMTIHTEVHGRVDSQSESIKAFLFRTAREILFNAVKHARVKEVRLRLQRRGERLWLTIADRGLGFDPKALGRTTGFGLLSIRERVGLLGGRMKIRSAPGRGSTFLIVVPDARAAEEIQQAVGPRREATGARTVSGLRPAASGGRLRVLLVDDHKVMREGLAALIGGQQDMEIVGQAGDGAEAIEQAHELQPDVIIMDVAMPVMPGDEATRRIKAELPQTRIIALSMFAEPGVQEKMLDAGAETYLAKTGPAEEFLAAIRGRTTKD